MQFVKKRAFVTFLFAALAVGANAQQGTDPNTAHAPDVYLDNHRPLIQKKQKAPTSRTVTGQVVDDSGAPLEGALVILTNKKTNEKTQFFTKKDGRYVFEDLSFTIDYEVQAKYKDQSSEPRKLSQYDRTAKVVRILEVADAPALHQSVTAGAKKDAPPAKQQ
ncbi:MAG: carboxypeptidase regulatory-like domain-containing protein [Acidobacteriaceae bacterium]|nr:carboxypeptidase regulatory-like domain-containing protein [Acidobacteriaceae bacterium]MBV9500403.1 carboxypeptidase regulatory-like domain-containing protein [Acidobacteriaceae bacterium]